MLYDDTANILLLNVYLKWLKAFPFPQYGSGICMESRASESLSSILLLILFNSCVLNS